MSAHPSFVLTRRGGALAKRIPNVILDLVFESFTATMSGPVPALTSPTRSGKVFAANATPQTRKKAAKNATPTVRDGEASVPMLIRSAPFVQYSAQPEKGESGARALAERRKPCFVDEFSHDLLPLPTGVATWILRKPTLRVRVLRSVFPVEGSEGIHATPAVLRHR